MSVLLCAAFLVAGPKVGAQPPPKDERASRTRTQASVRAEIIASANGWTYVKGEWVHPDGYKFVNHKILRTTAKPGKPLPKPPGKLALENPDKVSAPDSSTRDDKTAAEKAAEARRKNLTPTAAPQTGTHL